MSTPAVQFDKDLRARNTLRLPCTAQRYFAATTLEALQSALQECASIGVEPFILGEGSNTVFLSDSIPAVVHNCLRGITLVDEGPEAVTIDVAAGENWHALLEYCLSQHWHGLENLALIPGSVGAAPVQNIGAYGVELAEFLHSVEVVAIDSGRLQRLMADECEFAYRDSIFKGHLRGQVVISSVRLRLLRAPPLNTEYQALKNALPAGPTSARDIFDTVVALRSSKLPDPAVNANAGSFFKNPVVSRAQLRELQQQFPGLVYFPAADAAQVKLAAAWMIEYLGWKGRSLGNVGMHDKQALVLVNTGAATGSEVLDFAHRVAADVHAAFGVALEVEPVVI